MGRKAYDVVVAGGGIAGTMAALAAAHEGADVLLVERYSALGGMATLGLVQPITTWGIRNDYVIGGRGRAMLEGLAARHPQAATPMNTYGPSCDSEFLKFELERQAVGAGVELLYHAWVMGTECTANRGMEALRVLSKDGQRSVKGKVFVDGTGDADLAVFSGVPYDVGSQGISLMFVVSGIDRKRCPERNEIARLYAERKVGYRGLALFWHPRQGSAYFNVTEVEGVDALSAEGLTYATVECRRQAWEVLGIMQERVPGFENAYIETTASALGVRETRRIRGLYQLTIDDVTSGADFGDTIARASCPVDVHGSEDGGKGQYYGIKRSYGIPYRCLVTERVPNLIVTGRPISSDHAAHSSLRRMAPGFALGEAAGVAAAMAVRTGKANAIDTDLLRARLLEHGAVLEPESGHAG